MATANNDDWTEERCIQLIREYRNRPILWDSKNAFFFKKFMKQACWQEIGTLLGVTADECKHKMTILTSSFRREKAKIMHSLTDGEDSGIYQTAWFAFKEMVFLMDREAERKRQLGIEDDDVNTDKEPSAKRTLLTLHLKPTASKKGNVIGPKKLKSYKGATKKQLTKVITHNVNLTNDEPPVSVETQPKPQTSAEPTTTTKLDDEEIGSFATFIANKMKKYTEKTKNAVQQAICEIVFKADQNHYESQRCERFTIIDNELDPFDRIPSSGIVKIENDSDMSD